MKTDSNMFKFRMGRFIHRMTYISEFSSDEIKEAAMSFTIFAEAMITAEERADAVEHYADVLEQAKKEKGQ